MKSKLKSGIYLMLVSTLIVTLSSCKKENDHVVEEKINEFSDEFVYRIFFTDQGMVKEALTNEEIKGMNSRPTLSSRNDNNAKANGDFSTPYNSLKFLAMENNGGVQGFTDWEGFFLGEYFKGKPVCIIVEGNVAVVGTEVLEADESIPIGSYIYFRVTDNGNGKKAPADQMTSVAFITSAFNCERFHPSSDRWLPYAEFDVEGKITVK